VNEFVTADALFVLKAAGRKLSGSDLLRIPDTALR
jgi:hypothetical protein